MQVDGISALFETPPSSVPSTQFFDGPLLGSGGFWRAMPSSGWPTRRPG